MSASDLRATARKILQVIGSKTLCIVHHWDADGVASAATLSLVSKTVAGYYVPPYTYRVDGRVIEEIKRRCGKSGAIAIVDYNLPGGSLDLLWAKLQKLIIVIDHHYQLEPPMKPFILWFNPASNGDPRGFWPSAAHVIASLTGMYKPLVVALSIVGDIREKARASRVYQKYMVEAKLDHLKDYSLITECVAQIMAADIMGRRDILEHLASRMGDYDTDPCRILLEDGLLSILRVQVEEEYNSLIQKALENGSDIAGVRLFRLEGKGRHVSAIARKLANIYRNKIIMVSYHWKPLDRTYVYIRTEREEPKLIDLIKYARSEGFTAGGKYQPGNNVVGIEIEGKAGEDAVESILSWIHMIR
ncbi:MAG: hypothetical protein F7B60_01075 [Desulfurococcales archaeon]|nr:hypothetical protein [Desulfurococcales archaeon]